MILVQEQDFDLAQVYQSLRQQAGDPGAIVTFTGLVREIYDQDADASNPVTGLFLEHYPGMTEKCLEDIARQARDRWPLQALCIIHRVGELSPGDQIVLVGTASAHRHAAFEAAQFMMDYLKSKAPFWKKQRGKTGSEWVESRDSDSEAIARWQK
jgi:molybdopterin synthase catalytic subunit